MKQQRKPRTRSVEELTGKRPTYLIDHRARNRYRRARLALRVLTQNPAAGRRPSISEQYADLSRVKAGDMILSINNRPTIGGFFSRQIANRIGGPYSHVAPVVKTTPEEKTLGKTIGNLLTFRKDSGGKVVWVKDFKIGVNGVTRKFTEVDTPGIGFVVTRWAKDIRGKEVSSQQILDFLENVKRIQGPYDTPQAVWYGVKYGLERIFGFKFPDSWKVDFEKFWTCSEQLSHAANPPQKLLDNKTLVPVRPRPMTFNKNIDIDNVTPTTIYFAIQKGLLTVVTKQESE